MFAVAVASGLSAVEAAQAGYRGDPALLDGGAFEETWGFALDRDRLTAMSVRHSVYQARWGVKPFCSAKQSIAAVEALRTILASGIAPASIAAVRVRVPPAYAGMVGLKAQDQVRTTTLVSAARQLALLACDPARLYDVDRREPVTDAATLSFEAKVEIVADPALAQYYPGHWPREEVEVGQDGSTRRELVIAAPGDPDRPLDDGVLEDKAHRLLDRLIGRDGADQLLKIAGRGFADKSGCRALAGAFVQGFAAAADGHNEFRRKPHYGSGAGHARFGFARGSGGRQPDSDRGVLDVYGQYQRTRSRPSSALLDLAQHAARAGRADRHHRVRSRQQSDAGGRN